MPLSKQGEEILKKKPFRSFERITDRLTKKKRAYRQQGTDQRRDFMKRVYTLRIRRYTMPQIATELGVPISTIFYYIQEIKRVYSHELKDLTCRDVAEDVFLASRERIQFLWGTALSTKNEAVKLGCMNSIREEEKHCVAIGQELGLIRITTPTRGVSDGKTPLPDIHIDDPKELQERLRLLADSLDEEIKGRP